MVDQNDKPQLDRLTRDPESYQIAKAIKQRARGQGFKYALSLYAVLKDKTTNRCEFRRIEVLSNKLWNGSILQGIYDFFKAIKPPDIYTIWVYDGNLKAIKFQGGFN